MTVLCDASIAGMRSNFTPWDASNVNPASLDLRLGDVWIDLNGSAKPFRANGIWLYPNVPKVHIHNLWARLARRDKWYTLVLATTIERISVPDYMYAMIKLKTTPCRKGLGHPIADWIDPGFQGQLTLMLHAFKPIYLSSGMKICQLVLGLLNYSCTTSYAITGHYQNQSGPTVAWEEHICHTAE